MSPVVGTSNPAAGVGLSAGPQVLTTTTIRLVQAAAVFVSAVFTGTSLSLSAAVTPRLLESPTGLMLRQWAHMYAGLKLPMPLACFSTGAAYFWLAYKFGIRQGLLVTKGRAYLAAGALCAGILPYTLVIMMHTNNRLNKKAADVERSVVVASAGKTDKKEAEAAESAVINYYEEPEVESRGTEGAKYLVDHWGMLNLVRTGMAAVGTVLGLHAALF